MSEKNYKPISCDFHSELELRALHKKPVEIKFRDEKNEETSITALIDDLVTHKDGEFLILPDERKIRLDKLISVDGLKLADYNR